MPVSRVVHLHPHSRPQALVPEAPRVITAFGAALQRMPRKPQGVAACVAYLQESAARLLSLPMGMQALRTLRNGLFEAAGREAEMAVLWREALATACYARVVAAQCNFDAPLLTGAGLLHRAGEIAALRALAQAEQEAGQRLMGPVMQQILDAHDAELVARVTRSWGLPGEMRLLILRWRTEQDQPQRPEAVSLLTMAQALATELVHAATCAPDLAAAAAAAMHLPHALVEHARAATSDIGALLSQA